MAKEDLRYSTEIKKAKIKKTEVALPAKYALRKMKRRFYTFIPVEFPAMEGGTKSKRPGRLTRRPKKPYTP